MITTFNGDTVASMAAGVREEHPMIHHITNSVVTNFTANITLAMGAAPVMAPSIAESAQMAGFAGALLLNIGTINPELLESMLAAGKAANEKGIPVILDPVGAGATGLRTNATASLLSELNISVVRGNAGEILSLAGSSGGVRGVDSLATGEGKDRVFADFARKTGIITVVSGETDFVTDGTNWIKIYNGHPVMTSVTGTGCGATTAAACFAASGSGLLQSVAAGIACYNIAGEIACDICKGPGSFVPEFIDQLANLTGETILNKLRIETNL
ncbi:MAG: hydroxyethylthiazole kinase [Candidatus Sabulitectum sp.]|nr:hydroxyethylthiazole kinase [Candidatus Sabulitectum sp.]